MIDLDQNVDEMATEDLLAYQQAVTRLRLDALDAGRRVQSEIDRRAEQRAAERAAEDEALGAVRKPPTQQAFGDPEEQMIGPDDVAPVSGVLRKA